MKKLLGAALFILGFGLAGLDAAPVRYVQISTNNITQQTGGLNVSSGTVGQLTVSTMTSPGSGIYMNSKLLTGLTAGTTNGHSIRYEQLKILNVSMTTVDGASSTVVTSGFVNTGLSASITPSSTANKVLVLVFGVGAQSNSGEETRFTISRDGNNLGGSSGIARVSAATTNLNAPLAMAYLDSPSSTSSVTYTVRFFVTAGTGTLGYTNGRSVMILAEVNGN